MGAFFRQTIFFIILFLIFLWVQCMEHMQLKLHKRPHLSKFTFIYILLFDCSAGMFRYHSNRHCAESRP